MDGLSDFYQGNTRRYLLTFTYQGERVDITGWTVWFTLKREWNDLDEDSVVQKRIETHSNPTNGETEVVLEPNDTKDVSPGEYYYDIQVRDSSGNIATVLSGKLKILPRITREV